MMKDEDQVKFYDLVEEIEKLCHQRGEMSLAEIETMALAKEVRPSAVLEELSLSDFYVNLAEGKVKCR